MARSSILIVDDDPSIRMGLSPVLRSGSVEVDTAGSLEEAVGMVQDNRYDLVITDLRLTNSLKLEGLDLVSCVKKRDPSSRVVVLTAFGSRDIETEAQRRGASACWSKSLDIPELLDRVRSLGVWAGPESEGSESAESGSGSSSSQEKHSSTRERGREHDSEPGSGAA